MIDILKKIREYDQVLSSESGRFFCLEGIVQRFEPNIQNVMNEDIDLPKAHMQASFMHYHLIVKTMLVPSGVR